MAINARTAASFCLSFLLFRIEASGEKAFGWPGRGPPAFRSSGAAGGPARLPASPLVRGAAGMQLGGDGGGRDSAWQRGWRQPAREPAGVRFACVPVERDRRWPRPHARGPARVGGGRDAALAAMAAVGMWLGSADEGSPSGGRGRSSPAIRSSGDGREPRPPARWPVREGAAGMQLGGDGGGRDSAWQRG